MRGLRAVGAFSVDIQWQDNQAKCIVITSDAGQKAVINYPSAASLFTITDSEGNVITPSMINDDEIEFDTQAGSTYTLSSSLFDGCEDITAQPSPVRSILSDLSGRMHPSDWLMRPGIYIVGGKKILIK